MRSRSLWRLGPSAVLPTIGVGPLTALGRLAPFLLAGVVEKFRFLRTGLAIVLTFIGIKMLIGAIGFHIPILFSLAFVAAVLLGSVIFSLR